MFSKIKNNSYYHLNSEHITFIQKGNGRIFVFKEEHVERVKKIIEKIDGFESNYLPDDFITLWKGDINDLVYTGKFGIHIPKLIEVCAEEKIGIFCRTVMPTITVEI